MTEKPKILESKATIRFQHCDPFNHLNNSEYLNYLVNAREDQLIEHYNIDIYKMGREEGKSWVVGSNQIAYLRPAWLMEEVVIESQLLGYDTSSLQVELRMYNAQKSELKALMWSTYVHFDILAQKRTFHTDHFMELFASVKNPVPEVSFEARVAAFKKVKN
ncbi:MAG TPA: acyl-CoA thioesterase [Flavobacteriaceae bacterium]|nr:acyl-CoA thioesterase [Flavobacteriaceae bacterium]MCB9213793.1 acyl-CoA thioesterase [Alteromonas sp.]HPF10867.1 acyl-CoA thioesterase [Flavobacteriaceae bacterium]HQU22178.1 acyl-CoA thioesterase [Flavobacteriaceae bacterium]HQU66514.1 acyl-CoA thioesterase [Flavobacteriaceae bacterium]